MNLKDQIETISRTIDVIKSNMTGCKKCQGGIIKTEPTLEEKIQNDKLKRLGFKMSDKTETPCNCTLHNGKPLEDYENKRSGLKQKLTILQRQIPEVYLNCDYETIDTRIIDFIKSGKVFLWLYGSVGTGKTYSIYSLKALNLIKGYRNVKIVKEYDFNYDTKLNYNDIICIDDIGTAQNENRYSSLAEQYFKLIDTAIEEQGKIIFTSNLTLKDFVNKIANVSNDISIRIASRMSNVTDVILLQGDDRRKMKL